MSKSAKTLRDCVSCGKMFETSVKKPENCCSKKCKEQLKAKFRTLQNESKKSVAKKKRKK